jgi:cytolysin-activating lysine-acyltransferase
MRNSFLNVYERPDETLLRANAMTGFAASLLAQCPGRGGTPVSALAASIVEPYRQGNAKFYFDAEGHPAAYVTWAYLAPDTERRVMRAGELKLSPLEWNEGASLWIVDLVVPQQRLNYVLADLRDHVFADAATVRYARRNGERFIVREVARASTSHFFNQPARRDRSCGCGQPDCSAMRTAV